MRIHRHLRHLPVLAVAACALALADPAVAGNKGKGKNKGGSQGLSTEVQTLHAVAGLISAVERTIIHDYLTRHGSDLPPVFAEAKPLPPGIAQKVARGGTLPPGIAKKAIPGGLLSSLPPRPGQTWLVVGTDVLIADIATHVIVDVLKDVIRSG